MKEDAAGGEVWSVTEAERPWSSCVRALRARIDAQPLLPALLAGALALVRFGSGLGAREISLLESQDLSIAAEILHTFRLTADHSPLHFILLNLWLRLAGFTVALVRLPSAVFVAFATAVVFRLAQRVSGVGAAMGAALLFANNPEIVDQARSLRLYGLGILLAALCLERAEAYVYHGRRERALVGFFAAAVLAVHTHLFLWLWVAPLALLVAVRAIASSGGATLRRTLRAGSLALLLVVPQIIHGFAALVFTHDRHAIYHGVSTGGLKFVDEVGRHLLLGEDPELVPISGYALAAVLVLPLVGARQLTREARRAVAFACGLPFLVTFALSFVSEVEARYLCFALPGLAVLSALGIVALPAAFGEGMAIAVIAISVLATARAYGPPASDWRAGADRLEASKAPEDVVAVFPGYWAETFRLYTHLRELVPITYPVDLERALLRGRRVLLVVNAERYTGDLNAYLQAYTERRTLFATNIRERFEVDALRFTAPRASPPEHAPATVLFAGLVGSGGYPWASGSESGAHAFDGVRSLFASADLSVVGYAPLEPPWPAQVLLGPALAASLRPNRTVTDALHAAGVDAAVVNGNFGDPATAGPVLDASRVAVIPAFGTSATSKPWSLNIGGEQLALLSLARDGSGPGLAAHFTSAVAEARSGLGPAEALVVFVPEPATFDALPTAAERLLAHRLIDAGADVVVGIGGSAAQPVELYQHGLIAYSLGTLALTPELELVAREATGIALRVQFERGRVLHFEALPVAFDDRSKPTLGRLDTVPTDVAAGFTPFTTAFPQGRVQVRSEGPRSLAYVKKEPIPLAEALFDEELRRWLPWSPRGTSRRPFDGRFAGGASYAGIRGVRSLGVPRAAIELDTPSDTTLALEFPALPLGRRVVVTYALPDDREQSKFRPFLDETLRVNVDKGPSVSTQVAYRAGWQSFTLDTTALMGAPRALTVELAAPASHFPVAVELRVEP